MKTKNTLAPSYEIFDCKLYVNIVYDYGVELHAKGNPADLEMLQDYLAHICPQVAEDTKNQGDKLFRFHHAVILPSTWYLLEPKLKEELQPSSM